MKTSDFNQIVEDCLYRIKNRNATIEECIDDYPEHKAFLLPVLESSLILIKESKKIDPSVSKDRIKSTLLNQVISKKAAMNTNRDKYFSRNHWFTTRLSKAIASIAAVFIIGSGTVYASTKSNPGSPLYPLKLTVEKIQLFMTLNHAQKARLQLEFSERRMNEIKNMSGIIAVNNMHNTIDEMVDNLRSADQLLDEIQNGDKEELKNRIKNLSEDQIIMLENKYESAPAEDKDEITKAINESQQTSQSDNNNSGPTETNQNGNQYQKREGQNSSGSRN